MSKTRRRTGRAGKKSDRSGRPSKRTVNLATVGVEKINIGVAIPAIVFIVIAAVIFGKFCVADRLMAMSRARGRAGQAQTELRLAKERLAQYSELEEKYAHYTYSGMTEDELSRADRVAAIDLINRVIEPGNSETSWVLVDNQLTITVSGSTLQEINLLMQRLQREPLVSYCTVTTARMNEDTAVKTAGGNAGNSGVITSGTQVVANIMIYLQNVTGES